MTATHAESVHAVKVDGVWSTSIDYHISLEPLGRRVRGYLNGVPVVDSLNKGEAVYWSVRMPERTVEDVVWSYPRPIAECPRIASLMCFFNEVVDAILVDGVAEPKTRTRWSRN